MLTARNFTQAIDLLEHDPNFHIALGLDCRREVGLGRGCRLLEQRQKLSMPFEHVSPMSDIRASSLHHAFGKERIDGRSIEAEFGKGGMLRDHDDERDATNPAGNDMWREQQPDGRDSDSSYPEITPRNLLLS